MQANPQNPYQSFVVSASAGSGKTYQLARRFLNLVAAGAHPSSILTVTFTRKAALEMEERILQLARKLMEQSSFRASFDEQQQAFFHEARNTRLPKPKSAGELGQEILAHSQSLMITTMDALFMRWTRRFAFEASDTQLAIPAAFCLANSQEIEQQNFRAFEQSLQLEQQQLFLAWRKQTQDPFPLRDLKNQLQELQRHESFLWYLSQKAELPLKLFSQDLQPKIAYPLAARTLFVRLAEEGQLSKKAEILAALECEDAFAQLVALRVIKSDGTLHGNLLRGEKKQRLESITDAIDQFAQRAEAQQKKQLLNERSLQLYQAYQHYLQAERALKQERESLSFADLMKAAYQLFHKPEAIGIRFYLHQQIRHLLLDEFQDTSQLQWSIFQSMAKEMLAGQGLESPDGLPPSVFIVGDKKQSIYGFREAEAAILDEAAQLLQKQKAELIELSASYRSHSLLLTFVNQLLSPKIEAFPQHVAAKKDDAEPLHPGPSSLCLLPLCESEVERPIEEEAKQLAAHLRALLQAEPPTLIFDKETGAHRALKPQDCAILYRAATHAGIFAEALRREGIPSRSEESSGFFDRWEIKDAMALLACLAYPQNLIALMQILRSPMLALPDALVLGVLSKIKVPLSPRSLLPQVLDLLSQEFQICPPFLQAMQASQDHESAPYRILSLMDQFTLPASYASFYPGEEGEQAAANLQQFQQLILAFEQEGIYDAIPLYEALRQKAEAAETPMASLSQQAVTLSTIHKSKGLEFPLVALVGLAESWEKPDPYWLKVKDEAHGQGLYYVGKKTDRPSQDPELNELQNYRDQQALAENIRLLYVALTRAQSHLVLSGSRRLRKKSPEPYFFEDCQQALLSMGAQAKDQAPLRLEACSLAIPLSRPLLDPKPKHEAKRETKTSPIAKGGLPELKILAPARLLAEQRHHPKAEADPLAREFGLFVHKALECAARGVDFAAADYWQSLRGEMASQWPAPRLEEALQKSERVLRSTLWQALLAEAQSIKAECPIAYIEAGFLVRGVIDLLLELKDGHIFIIDYKSVSPLPAPEALANFIREMGYDEQLKLYHKGVQRLYPERKIRLGILFTEGPHFLELS